MYAVQNDTGIKFNIELYIKVIFFGQGVGIESRGCRSVCCQIVCCWPISGRWNKRVTEVFTVTEAEVWDILI